MRATSMRARDLKLTFTPPLGCSMKNNPTSTSYLAIRNTLYRREIEFIRTMSGPLSRSTDGS